jgi:hypothetical protein
MRLVALLSFVLVTCGAAPALAEDLTRPIANDALVFEERDGLLAVEAEHFFEQSLTERRAWHLTTRDVTPRVEPDGDPSHIAGASGGAYLELLPDTRRSHDDKLVHGENFSNEPGKMAVLFYKVRFNTPGVYHLWARAFTTTTEDNGLHFGLDGEWPETAQRWQTTTKNRWHWESKQRTQQVHTGVPGILTLTIERPGDHTLQVCLREDGIAIDKLLLVNRKDYRPEGPGPDPAVAAGALPQPFPFVAAEANPPEQLAQRNEPERRQYPAHWGEPPAIQTRDLRPLPGGYGMGSGTLARWIQTNLDQDAAAKSGAALIPPRQPDGDGTVTISGELKQWHKVTLDVAGPFANERDSDPNPFTDRNLRVTFTHESGAPKYVVPGYFAADGKAAETSAASGTIWRAHLSPDKPGRWDYVVSFTTGKHAALDGGGKPLAPFDGQTGRFTVAATDKTGRDFRAQGRLQYVGKRHLQFAGSGEYFLKAGPDSPETLLGYADFDNTVAGKPGKVPLKTWGQHVRDWRDGDPTWNGDKGKGLIGALNYLSDKGLNVCSFLTYNAGGDGDNVWPFVERDGKLHYDCSKLDQWGIVFDHATTRGLYLHFKMQEQEVDDDRRGHEAEPGRVPVSLDGGRLGSERKLYCRELIARFGHNLALNWNLGEENTQSFDEQRDMIAYLQANDPYDHNVVVHTFPDWQDQVYTPLLGSGSLLTGASLQNGWIQVHQRTGKWVAESAQAGRPWVVANDEQGPASLGVPPDPGYEGHDGVAREKDKPGYTLDDVRRATLWGNLMAGGAGVEYYFGYSLPQNDLVCEDFRSRERSWDYCRIALELFREQRIPFERMDCRDELVGNVEHDNSRYCLTAPGEVYLIYLPKGGTCDLDLSGAAGKTFTVKWFNPRAGGALRDGSVKRVTGPQPASLGRPPAEADEDWVVVVR